MLGRWAEGATYATEDVADILSYAHFRGIRVVPEVDVPGHTYSWGLAYPGINAECPAKIEADIGRINDVPLDPTNPLTLEIVHAIVKEMAAQFPDAFFHIGGDEFDPACWMFTTVSPRPWTRSVAARWPSVFPWVWI